MSRPLEGIRVIEWAAHHAGPGAGYMLSDLGAEVIKIEEPVKGDPLRGFRQMFGQAMSTSSGSVVQFELANRNKKSVAIDLRQPEGKAILYELVKVSDAFYTNYFRNDVLQRKEVDYETLRQYNPGLIYAVNTAYGSRGPAANMRAWDLSIQARSGFMWSAGDRDSTDPTLNVSAPIDQMSATMLAFAIVTALLARERSGVGQKVEVSMLGSAIHLQALTLNPALLRGRPFARHSRARCREPLCNYYRCADGAWLYITEIQGDRFWPELCRVLGLQEIEEDSRFGHYSQRSVHYAELISILDERLATRTRDEWLDLFRENRVEFSYSPIYNHNEVLEDPQVLENKYLVDFDHPVLGKIKWINMPMQFSEGEVGPITMAPELGQHTEEVLLDVLGRGWEDIAELKQKGVIP